MDILNAKIAENGIKNEKSAWIVRYSPDFIDLLGVIRGSISKPPEVTMLVARDREKMEVNDNVYIWESMKENSKIVAIGHILERPRERLDLEEMRAYYKDSNKFGKEHFRIVVGIDRIIPNGISRCDIENNNKLKVIKDGFSNPNASNYNITTAQEQELWALIEQRESQANTVATIGPEEEQPVEKQNNGELEITENDSQVNTAVTEEKEKSLAEGKNYIEPQLKDIVESVKSQGMRIIDADLKRYHLSLKTRKFVILWGVSGTGKTLLAKTYAKAVKAKCEIVPVAPNWTTNEDLLGFLNLSVKPNEYKDTPFSSFLKAAEQEYKDSQIEERKPQPYHIILDEMNLARVEYYFAKFLSAMENRIIEGKGKTEENEGKIHLDDNTYIELTPNVFVIGTVNIDETTHGFSDKVYDRAQLMEIRASKEELTKHIGEEPYREILLAVWEKVCEIAPFAYRTTDDIKQYIKLALEMGLTWEGALDDQILQKILPKVKGLDSKVETALKGIIELTAEKFPRSHEKAKSMLKGYNNHGFVSYF